MRAVAEIEEGRRGEQRIVVTEVPYQTSVEVIGQKVAELVNERKMEGIRDVRNESAGGSNRLVIELRRDANANVVLNQLYKHTAMQTSFPVNMLALVDGVPRLLSIDRAILVYVNHQIEVVRRRTEYRLRRAKEREHIVEGLVKALDTIDAVIALIRGAADVDKARSGLMGKKFGFTEIQANYILDMQLRRLTQLEGQKLRDELAELRATIKELESILKSKTKLRKVIKDELLALKEKYGDARRTRLTADTGEIDMLDLIEDEEVVVVLTDKGYIKTVAADAFRRQRRGGAGVRGSRSRDDDYVHHLLTTTAGAYLLFATKKGIVKKTRMSEYDTSVRNGLIAINLPRGDELVRVIQTTGKNDVVMVSHNGQTIRFAESGVRPMGRNAAGVHGMKLREGDAVVSCDVYRRGAVMLFVSSSGHGKRTKLDLFHKQGRGGQGVRGMRITAARGGVVGAFTVTEDDEFLVFSSAGNIIRMPASEVSAQGRDATGVRVARLGDGETIVAVAPVLEGEAGEDA